MGFIPTWEGKDLGVGNQDRTASGVRGLVGAHHGGMTTLDVEGGVQTQTDRLLSEELHGPLR